jgi:hypothetical protein
VTLIPPFSIIWGKLLSSVSFILLLLLLSVPIFSLVFLFGGIELDQVLEAFLVTAVTAITLGTLGIAFSTWLRRTLPATVAAYAAAFILLAGSLLYGLLFPTDVDPRLGTLPSPPVATYLGPILPLVTIATNAPVSGYGIRYQNPYPNNGGMACSSFNGGPPTCLPTGPGLPGGSIASFRPLPAAQLSSTLSSGPFTGWQYWQASVAMQLGICFLAILLSAFLLPPIRRFRLSRARAQPAAKLEAEP